MSLSRISAFTDSKGVLTNSYEWAQGEVRIPLQLLSGRCSTMLKEAGRALWHRTKLKALQCLVVSLDFIFSA